MMKFLFVGIISSIFLICIISGLGCANIIPPSGGPRDTVPPRLIKADPADSTVNFHGNRITLQFDEFIDLQDLSRNIVMSPLPENNPILTVKLRTLDIRLRDTLEPNTTYTINFGNAIRDINEANVLRDFTYTFATGNAFDSLQLRGKVILAQNGKIDSTLIVVLHKNLSDSAVVNDRPRYITKLNASGSFVFKNLPAGIFAIYAIGDAGSTRKYLNKNQLFAFADAPVSTGDTTAPIILYAYREISATAAANKPTAITAPRGTNIPQKRLQFTTNLTNGLQDLQKDLVLAFDQPLRNVDTTKIFLTSDTTFSPVQHTITVDSSKKHLDVHVEWKESTRYNLIFDKDFAEDTSGRKLLKTDTLTFTTRKLADYARINIRLKNVDSAQNPVLQFVQNDAVVFSAAVISGNFSSQSFLPGDYELRVLFDTNKNGQWDPGSFFGIKRQPEVVKPIERHVTVKVGTENNFEVSLL
ncbi:MAG: Ig-like domain-containing protein [Chitinophagaceae bacterium]|nr:Ig-like domain-containing protein [Chitinophagaceae bacterium]